MNEVGSGSGGMAKTGDTEGDEGLETHSGVKRSTEHVKRGRRQLERAERASLRNLEEKRI